MEGASRRSLGPQAQHTHSMENHTWSIQYTQQQLHHIQQQNNKHTQTYCELFHQTIHKYRPTHKTNRPIDRATQNIQGYNIDSGLRSNKTNQT